MLKSPLRYERCNWKRQFSAIPLLGNLGKIFGKSVVVFYSERAVSSSLPHPQEILYTVEYSSYHSTAELILIEPVHVEVWISVIYFLYM